MEEAKIKFCAEISAAARKLGIGITKEGNAFVWYDPAGGVRIYGKINQDEQAAYQSACEELVEYLSCKPSPA